MISKINKCYFKEDIVDHNNYFCKYFVLYIVQLRFKKREKEKTWAGMKSCSIQTIQSYTGEST